MNLRYTLRLEVRDCADCLVGVREIDIPVSASTAQEQRVRKRMLKWAADYFPGMAHAEIREVRYSEFAS